MDDARLSPRAIRQDPAQLSLQGLIVVSLVGVKADAVFKCDFKQSPYDHRARWSAEKPFGLKRLNQFFIRVLQDIPWERDVCR